MVPNYFCNLSNGTASKFIFSFLCYKFKILDLLLLKKTSEEIKIEIEREESFI